MSVLFHEKTDANQEWIDNFQFNFLRPRASFLNSDHRGERRGRYNERRGDNRRGEIVIGVIKI